MPTEPDFKSLDQDKLLEFIAENVDVKEILKHLDQDEVLKHLDQDVLLEVIPEEELKEHLKGRHAVTLDDFEEEEILDHVVSKTDLEDIVNKLHMEDILAYAETEELVKVVKERDDFGDYVAAMVADVELETLLEEIPDKDLIGYMSGHLEYPEVLKLLAEVMEEDD